MTNVCEVIQNNQTDVQKECFSNTTTPWRNRKWPIIKHVVSLQNIFNSITRNTPTEARHFKWILHSLWKALNSVVHVREGIVIVMIENDIRSQVDLPVTVVIFSVALPVWKWWKQALHRWLLKPLWDDCSTFLTMFMNRKLWTVSGFSKWSDQWELELFFCFLLVACFFFDGTVARRFHGDSTVHQLEGNTSPSTAPVVPFQEPFFPFHSGIWTL